MEQLALWTYIALISSCIGIAIMLVIAVLIASEMNIGGKSLWSYIASLFLL